MKANKGQHALYRDVMLPRLEEVTGVNQEVLHKIIKQYTRHDSLKDIAHKEMTEVLNYTDALLIEYGVDIDKERDKEDKPHTCEYCSYKFDLHELHLVGENLFCVKCIYDQGLEPSEYLTGGI